MTYLLDRKAVIDYIALLERSDTAPELLAKAKAMLDNPKITEPER
jgi:hypothetical protein